MGFINDVEKGMLKTLLNIVILQNIRVSYEECRKLADENIEKQTSLSITMLGQKHCLACGEGSIEVVVKEFGTRMV